MRDPNSFGSITKNNAEKSAESFRATSQARGNKILKDIEPTKKREELLKRKAELEDKLRSRGIDPKEIEGQARTDFYARHNSSRKTNEKTPHKAERVENHNRHESSRRAEAPNRHESPSRHYSKAPSRVPRRPIERAPDRLPLVSPAVVGKKAKKNSGLRNLIGGSIIGLGIALGVGAFGNASVQKNQKNILRANSTATEATINMDNTVNDDATTIKRIETTKQNANYYGGNTISSTKEKTAEKEAVPIIRMDDYESYSPAPQTVITFDKKEDIPEVDIVAPEITYENDDVIKEAEPNDDIPEQPAIALASSDSESVSLKPEDELSEPEEVLSSSDLETVEPETVEPDIAEPDIVEQAETAEPEEVLSSSESETTEPEIIEPEETVKSNTIEPVAEPIEEKVESVPVVDIAPPPEPEVVASDTQLVPEVAVSSSIADGLDIAMRTAFAEGAYNSEDAARAIADVIINRALKNGTSVGTEVATRGQFEAYRNGTKGKGNWGWNQYGSGPQNGSIGTDRVQQIFMEELNKATSGQPLAYNYTGFHASGDGKTNVYH